jgi:hypothetical protein
MTTISELAKELGVDRRWLLRRLRADKVAATTAPAVTPGGVQDVIQVPDEWADQLRQRYKQARKLALDKIEGITDEEWQECVSVLCYVDDRSTCAICGDPITGGYISSQPTGAPKYHTRCMDAPREEIEAIRQRNGFCPDITGEAR